MKKKKLKLKKETIASLNDDEMNKIQGGDFTFNIMCYSYYMCSGKCTGKKEDGQGDGGGPLSNNNSYCNNDCITGPGDGLCPY